MGGNGQRLIVATDIVESTRLGETSTDLSSAWAAHDRAARDLIRAHGGLEIGRTDGIIALFDEAAPAVAFANAYHAVLAELPTPMQARVGVHAGLLALRRNPDDDVALGAVPLEVDGTVLPVAVRLQALAHEGQTLVTRAVLDLWPGSAGAVCHGFWRLKGVADPVEVAEVLRPDGSARRPQDMEKAFQVERDGDAWIAVAAGQARLPRLPGTFIGRAAETAEIADRLVKGDTVITLLGPGGAGKTRLAVHYARCGPTYFEGGAWFCDLSSATEADGVLQAVARALDVPLVASDVDRTLGHALATRGSVLLIVDNAESAAPAVAALLGELAQRAPQARYLVTSRVALDLSGESIVAVGPMRPIDAASLFEARARDAGTPLDDSARGTLPALVESLDRLPLALELSAARCASLTPVQQLERMQRRRQWLRAPAMAPVPVRHSTLSHVFEASWALLETVEQRVLAQCAVFEGGFGLDAAEDVLDAGGIWVGEVLTGLVRKSLLQRLDGGRMGLLRTVRDEVVEQALAPAERAAASIRHAAHFAALDERVVLTGGFADLENLVAACERATFRADGSHAVAALTLCAEVLLVRGPARRLLDLARKVEAVRSLDDGDRAEVLRVLGNALYSLGERERALEAFGHGLALANAAADATRRIRLACALATPWARAGQATQARALLVGVASDAARLGDLVRRCALANAWGTVEMAAQQLDPAVGHFEAALALAQAARHRRWEGGIRANLGSAHYLSGRRHEARHHYEAGLTIAQEIGDRAWAASARCNLGLLLLDEGWHEDARTMLAAALQVAQEIGQAVLQATVACNLGLLLVERDRPAEAVGLLHDAANMATRLADHGLAAQCERALGRALWTSGEPRAAATALERALQHAHAAEDVAEIVRCRVAQARQACSAEEAATALFATEEAMQALTPAQQTEFTPDLAHLRNATLNSQR